MRSSLTDRGTTMETAEEYIKRICASIDMNYRVTQEDVDQVNTRDSCIREDVLTRVERKTDDWESSWAVSNVCDRIREEMTVPTHIAERTFFVPKPGEEYDSYNGKRHVCITQVIFDERDPEGCVYYGPGEGCETLPLFMMKYRPTPSVGKPNE
jgi:hypothetical protein